MKSMICTTRFQYPARTRIRQHMEAPRLHRSKRDIGTCAKELLPFFWNFFFFFLKFLFSFLFFHLVTQLLRLLPIFPPTAKPSLYIQQLCVCMCVCVPCMFGSAVKRKRKRQCNKGGAKIRKKKRKRRRNMRETRKCPAVKRLYN